MSREAFGWPPNLPTRLATEYCGVTRWTLYRAVAAGELVPIGRRGRLQVFAREDLDRWMLGAAVVDRASSPATSTPSRPSTDVLARLRAIKAGAK